MKETIRRALWCFPGALVLTFVLLFFGLLPPKYNVTIYTDNIEGEGIVTAYHCAEAPFAPFYETGAYFGSELQQVTIPQFHYDVEYLALYISDVTAADILGCEVTVCGISTGSYTGAQMLERGMLSSDRIGVSFEGDTVHFEFEEPQAKNGILFQGFRPLPAWFWAAYWTLVVVAALGLALLAAAVLERAPVLRLPLLEAVGLLAALLAGCFFCGSLPYLNYTDVLLTWLLLIGAALMLNALTLPWLGTALTMLATLVWYAANYFVIQYRNKPVMPADLKVLGTLEEVIGGYSLRPTWQMVLGLAVCAGFVLRMVLLWRRGRKGGTERPKPGRLLLRRGCALAAGALLLFAGVNNPAYDALGGGMWDMVLLMNFHREGGVLSFLKSAGSTQVTEPEGYSRELVAELLEDYLPEEEPEGDGVRPTRIIMVMNEAFSDLRGVGMDESVDVMPFIDSLTENTISGYLYVSVFGGGTCNTEFEALTGNAMAFLGASTYPYQMYVTRPLFSLASYFSGRAYGTAAFHASKPTAYNRGTAYPFLGFDRFYSIEDYWDYGEVEYLRELPTDRTDYRVLEAVDGELGDRPLFLFNVTYQNHSGYERWMDLPEAPEVAAAAGDYYPDTRIYLSLVHLSDAAVQELVERYAESAEPTMIIFFGDHQPSLTAAAREDVYRDDLNALDYFKTKYFIWTNYETEAAQDVSISANYLPWLILERGNFPLPPFVRLLRAVHEQYPVLSAQGVIDAEGNICSTDALADDPLLQQYRCVQYANLFDELDSAWFS